MYQNYCNSFSGSWFGGGIGMMIIMIIVVGLILWLLFSRVSKQGTNEKFSDSNKAISILKERYAKGEIGKEEFEEKRLFLS